jgi:proteasome lid subunit RPN8/RPN11
VTIYEPEGEKAIVVVIVHSHPGTNRVASSGENQITNGVSALLILIT